MTCQFDYGIVRLVILFRSLLLSTLPISSHLLTLSIHSKLSLHLITTPAIYQTHFLLPRSTLPSVTQLILHSMHSQTQKVGSGTQQVAYCIGCPQTAVEACIRLLFLLSLAIHIFDQSLLTLTTLPLGLLGLTFSTVYILSFLLSELYCCLVYELLFAYCNSVPLSLISYIFQNCEG